MPPFKESLSPLHFCRRTHDFKYSAPQAFHSPQILPLHPCHCSLAPGTTFSHGPPPPPHLFPRLKAGRVLQQGLAGWLAAPPVFFFFRGWRGLCSIDWARSQTPASDAYGEAREESDGEERGWEQKGEGHPHSSLT